ncbi:MULTISPECIES: inner membrane protein YpjD [Aneurinibacillus]|uniref:Cytochrome c biogenesis protein n=1 Tax=Aneurinibacillus thermoaerophilus TaxID=143495 RepID=A0A1G7ZTJ0_ANETH|nr:MULTISPECIES: cytochrome c biogenesis protein CcsA [Aneurinibacillus]AMA72088.1 cytochrome C assembly protein [Aneurinibacillus sp. XH2]MED0676371.1 cytochrome c biogenesis protein CcsA [Aneurinibacillus thermoaerophilus]MED0678883.1 cytochrome c biogenesis protein CcsA [Aneurinibacillus thermoaerophilus]MED0736420.1 cytochrome c biogenesis protein CcsA [Aneurinibacillus thermoaerophilus]MED0755923.1 cytochrome c biogenesis protein CcsA [Aneurinibacillus thermoaerophilus]
MFHESLIYDVIIYIYACSILLYFADFLNRSRKVNRIAFWLLAIVWALQSVFFVLSMVEKEYFPVLTLFETLFFYSWILVTFSLVINYLFRVDLLVFFTNVLGFSVLALNFFANKEASPMVAERLTSELLFIHISLALVSYGAFSLSFIFSLMYLVEDRMLKQKMWNKWLQRLPGLGLLDLYSYRLNMIGVPLLLLALILGAIWAHLKVNASIWLDPKVLVSVAVFIAYSLYLYQRVTYGWMGRKLALWNAGAFMLILLNYFISGSVLSFHQWL